MAVLNFDANTLTGENGVGKLYIATDYKGNTYPDGNAENEANSIKELEKLTFSDLGFFEKFEISIKEGDEKKIQSDYCGHTDIMVKNTTTTGFKADIHEILEMSNLAQILGTKIKKEDSGEEIIGIKTIARTKPYHCFKFVTCPKDDKVNVFYFVKANLTGDISIPFTNLAREDFTGVTLEFEVAQSGNTFIQKGKAV